MTSSGSSDWRVKCLMNGRSGVFRNPMCGAVSQTMGFRATHLNSQNSCRNAIGPSFSVFTDRRCRGLVGVRITFTAATCPFVQGTFKRASAGFECQSTAALKTPIAASSVTVFANFQPGLVFLRGNRPRPIGNERGEGAGCIPCHSGDRWHAFRRFGRSKFDARDIPHGTGATGGCRDNTRLTDHQCVATVNGRLVHRNPVITGGQRRCHVVCPEESVVADAGRLLQPPVEKHHRTYGLNIESAVTCGAGDD